MGEREYGARMLRRNLSTRGRVAAAALLAGVCLAGLAVGAFGKDPASFRAPKLFNVTGENPYPVDIADLNRDGRQDLLVGSEVNGTVSIFYGKKGGLKANPTDVPGGSYPFWIEVGKLNGDKRPDIVVADNDVPGTLTVLLANHSGGFRAPKTLDVADQPYAVAIADVNGDHKPDLLSADSGGIGISVLLGNGDGTFEAAVPYDAGATNPVALVVHDFTSDGKQDVAVLVQNDPMGAKVVLLNGDGHGAFAPPEYFDVGLQDPEGMVGGQFTGDHRLDLAIGSCSGNDPGKVVLLDGRSHGFKDKRKFPEHTGACSYKPVAVDINKDGRTDLITEFDGGAHSGGVAIHYGKSGGELSKGRFLDANVDGQAYSAAAGRLNSDRKLDLAVPDYEHPLAAVLFGK
jgi:hypothetical protein